MFPDDEKIDDMDPILKLWMFENWSEDYVETAEQNKNLSYQIGSFTNPTAVQNLLNQEKNTYTSDDAEFEELSKKIVEHNAVKNTTGPIRKRKRKIIK